jgi:[1-hydroxy-2-(trimethylamino)ethyl]phosphonate dioxygenase
MLDLPEGRAGGGCPFSVRRCAGTRPRGTIQLALVLTYEVIQFETAAMTIFDQIVELFAKKGDAAYFGEAVSQKEHALQAACLAAAERAPESLVVAALLHDVGHLVHGLPEDIADHGVDARHEAAGEAWLSRHFGPEVTEPVRLHVDAKRYLCRADPNYLRQLSPASVQSLALQGGPFSKAEARRFEEHRYFREAVRVRRWDDQAKVPGLAVPDLEDYREAVERTVRCP